MWLLLGCTKDGEIGLGEDPVSDTVLARTIHVRKRTDDGGTLRCEGVGVDDEVFEKKLPPAESGGESVRVDGLLADTTYRCEVVDVDRPSEVIEFTTDPLPGDLPRASLVEDGPAPGGYLLMNHGTDDKDDRQTKLLVYDDRGRLRYYYWVPFSAPDLDVQYIGNGQFLYGGGYRALPTVVDLTGTTVRQAPGRFEPGNYNHTVEQLSDGMVLTTETTPNVDASVPNHVWTGFAIELLDPTLRTRVYALNSQELVDAGDLFPGSPYGSTDPYHLNALVWRADEGIVVANLYRPCETLWIDVNERRVVERLGHASGWTLVDADGEPLGDEDWFYGQHAPEFDGDFLMYHDNGVGRPATAEKFSRAVEYELDHETRTARLVWEWTQPSWYENIWGDVDRRPGGKVSITHAHCEKCTDVAGQHTEVIVVDKATGDVDWRLRFSDPSDAGYRSEWIDGCDLFDRVSACVE